jgi:hypothetical protein
MKMSDLKFKPLKPGINTFRVLPNVTNPWGMVPCQVHTIPDLTVMRVHLDKPFASKEGAMMDIVGEEVK